jgi:hypothetical protein
VSPSDEGAVVPTSPLSAANRLGIGLAVLLSLMDFASLLVPTPPGEVGPPYVILLLAAALGVVTLVAVVIGWRSGSRGALRIAAGARVVSAITALPAFFLDVAAWIQLVVAVTVVLTIACVLLVLAPARRSAPVAD